jgi:hypothetical protein
VSGVSREVRGGAATRPACGEVGGRPINKIPPPFEVLLPKQVALILNFGSAEIETIEGW